MKATYQSSDGGAGSEAPSWLLEDEEVELSNGGGGSNNSSGGGNSGNNSETGVRGSRSSKFGSSSSSSNGREDNSGALMDDLIDCYCCHIDLSILSLQFFHIACISLALMSTISNAYEVTHKIGDGPVDFRDKMIRGFGVLLSIIAGVVELDLSFFNKYIALFEFWTCRAFLYILIGLVTMQIDRPLNKFQNVSGLGDVLVAFIYLIMVLFCVRSIKERRLARHRRGYQEIDHYNDI